MSIGMLLAALVSSIDRFPKCLDIDVNTKYTSVNLWWEEMKN